MQVRPLGWKDSLEMGGYPFQYSGLENSMDREDWWATVHGVTKSWTQLNTHTHTHTESHTDWPEGEELKPGGLVLAGIDSKFYISQIPSCNV